jgi:hypothetical protein
MLTIDPNQPQEPACYVLRWTDEQSYVRLDFWCSGEYKAYATNSISRATRFTREAAHRLERFGYFIALDEVAACWGDCEYIDPALLEAVYVPEFDSRNLPLPLELDAPRGSLISTSPP